MLKRLFGLLAALFMGQAVAAPLEFTVIQGEERAIPIAVVPFGAGAMPPEDVASIISADLMRSGKFTPMPPERMASTPTDPAQVNFPTWRAAGNEWVVVGRVDSTGGGYGVQFWLMDAVKGTQVVGYNINAPANRLRRAAHQIADIIYEKITGERGAFNTNIAYVMVEGSGKSKSWRLAVADSDGYNEQVVLTSDKSLMSPAWSPDGRRLAYVSFEQNRPVVYIQDVGSGQRRLVASFEGINSAPSWSPDGSRIALTLSKDGNAEIYVMDVMGGGLTRVTDSAAIETEAAWSPDGSKILFTSDRGGGPQIYQVAVDSGGRPLSSPERLTYNDSNYNARGAWSPDGKRITHVKRENGAFHVATQELRGGQSRVLTNSRLDESPSFAPNGSMIIFATEVGGRGVLETVSADGRARQRLGISRGDVRDPAWSPFAASSY